MKWHEWIFYIGSGCKKSNENAWKWAFYIAPVHQFDVNRWYSDERHLGDDNDGYSGDEQNCKAFTERKFEQQQYE